MVFPSVVGSLKASICESGLQLRRCNINEPSADHGEQLTMFDSESTRALLDQLLADSRLYRTSQDYKELLEFAARLRNFAPFNAMLLQLQKPGLRSMRAVVKDVLLLCWLPVVFALGNQPR